MSKYLNILPLYSKWIELLINEDINLIKNTNELKREFNDEKWSIVITKILNNEFTLIEEIDNFFINKSDVIYLDANELILDSGTNAFFQYKKKVLFYLNESIKSSKKIIEIGAGYGSILVPLANGNVDKKFVALDLSQNGIDSITFFGKTTTNIIEMKVFNFNDYIDFDFSIFKNSHLYFSYAAHYFSNKLIFSEFLNDVLINEVSNITFIEPIYEFFDQKTILGLFQQKYMKVNGYFTEIKQVIDEFELEGRIKITDVKPNLFGLNPLLPFSLITVSRI